MIEPGHVLIRWCPICGETPTAPGITDHECDPDLPAPKFSGLLAMFEPGPSQTEAMMPEVADQIPAHLDDVGPGWRPILQRLHEQVVALAPGYIVGQVKEKFGGLRVYLDFADGYDPRVEELLDAAEEESFRTCEDCGKPGEPRPGGWVKTLCDGCRRR